MTTTTMTTTTTTTCDTATQHNRILTSDDSGGLGVLAQYVARAANHREANIDAAVVEATQELLELAVVLRDGVHLRAEDAAQQRHRREALVFVDVLTTTGSTHASTTRTVCGAHRQSANVRSSLDTTRA
jgi:hypothetical protein